jgi:hypothetical protein
VEDSAIQTEEEGARVSINVSSLLAAASVAKPSPDRERCRRGRWSDIYPVYCRLREQRFGHKGALSWLRDMGAIKAGEEDKASNALMTLSSRRRKASKEPV